MLVILNDAGHQADEVDTPLLGVPGHKVPVQVGVWTQPPQLEVHLARVLAGAGDGLDLVRHADVVSPGRPLGQQHRAVLGGAALQLAVLQVHLGTSLVVCPYTNLAMEQNLAKRCLHGDQHYLKGSQNMPPLHSGRYCWVAGSTVAPRAQAISSCSSSWLWKEGSTARRYLGHIAMHLVQWVTGVLNITRVTAGLQT